MANIYESNQRLFLGLEIPDQIRQVLFEAASQHDAQNLPHWRWTKPEKYHVTLLFLGETDAALVPELQAGLSVLAKQYRPFELTSNSIQSFPDATSKVIALKLELDMALAQLRGNLVQWARSQNLLMERSAFLPHITLARRKRSASEAQPIVPKTLQLKWLVSEMALFESRAGEYQILDRFLLDFGLKDS